VFPFVLGYLRDGVVDLEGHDARMVRRVRREFDYFNIELLAEVSCVFVAGGYNHNQNSQSPVERVERYDVLRGEWAAVAPLPVPRFGLSLCALEGSLYAVGGRTAQRTSRAEVHAYDVANDTWRAVAPMGTARKFHGACSHGGHLYVVGGVGRTGLRLSSCERYDPVSDTWAAIAQLPDVHFRGTLSGRSHVGMCSLGNFLYVAGGFGLLLGNEACGLCSCFKYDPATDTWSGIAELRNYRLAHCLGAFEGCLYAIGGSSSINVLSSSVEKYDPTTLPERWSAVAALNVPRNCASCVVLDGPLHVLGGTPDHIDSVEERYDANADAWEVVPAMELTSALRFMGACSMVVPMNFFDRLLLERGRSQSSGSFGVIVSPPSSRLLLSRNASTT
jgi:hypothetical protein